MGKLRHEKAAQIDPCFNRCARTDLHTAATAGPQALPAGHRSVEKAHEFLKHTCVTGHAAHAGCRREEVAFLL